MRNTKIQTIDPLRFFLLLLLAVMPSAWYAFGEGPTRAPQSPPSPLEGLHLRIDRSAEAILPKVVQWRRDLHEHPELGNQETRTAGVIARHLQQLGLQVRTGIAKTGVIGVLSGSRPGKVVALRADMDALPVTEETGLPFASRARAQYNGREVGVMHACGHDYHMSMLMGAAEVLSGMKTDLAGTVVFLFQPAEEGAPEGETGGAERMVAEGALDNPKVDAVFGLHVFPYAMRSIEVRPGGIMAASDTVQITVRGRGTHGAMPAQGIDPIVVAAQIILGLQTIISRQVDLPTAPAVVTIGTIEGGNRSNIISDTVRMTGTIRTFDPEMRKQVLERVRRTAEKIAEAAGATAAVAYGEGYPVTYNDPSLTERMIPSLRRVAAPRFNGNTRMLTTAEDFSFYQQKIPGVYFFLGVAPEGANLSLVPFNHSSRFSPDEGAISTGVRALASLAVDFLTGR